jgi:hypothetical protein
MNLNYHGKRGKIAWLMRYVCDLWLAFFSVWSVRASCFAHRKETNGKMLLLQSLHSVICVLLHVADVH